jgi:hypothetical protein
MTRDVEERLTMFSKREVHIERLALNYQQVLDLNPPENPAKEKDARYRDYARVYGDRSWELDAIDPRQLVSLVENAIREKITDPQAWNDTRALEKTMTGQLLEVAKNLL